MSDIVHSENYKGYKINIHPDSDPESPRAWDNLGTMLCFHNRYTLGDKNPAYTYKDQSGWQELADKLIKEQHAAVILPLYLYDHSGITMSTGAFTCPWDSGQVGFIYVTREKLLKEYGGLRVSQSMVDKATKCLEGEVETYDHYLRGDVYGYTIHQVDPGADEDEDGEEVDACWGFLGDYDDKDYSALQAAKEWVDSEVESKMKKQFAQSMTNQGVEE